MNERWILRASKSSELIQNYHMEPVLARVLSARLRAQNYEDFMDREGSLFDPFLLLDMDLACRVFMKYADERRQTGTSVCILGDYDADGMTASSILYRGLSKLYPDLSFFVRIPNRTSEGYGIHASLAEEIISGGAGLVITCDNGIREIESIRRMKEAGLTVIVTDHHQLFHDSEGADLLPPADAVVDPQRKEDLSPQKEICGAFVALQFVRALSACAHLQQNLKPVFPKLIGLAALGTVCDVMPLLQENRKLVYQGLRALSEDAPSGIRALSKVSSLSVITETSLGFVLGPMINSGGRLGDQNHFIPLLITEDDSLAETLAAELRQLNQKRQTLTDDAVKLAAEELSLYSDIPRVIVVYIPSVEEGIIGLIAGKLCQQYSRPVFVVTDSKEGLKGSARSLEGYMIIQKMEEVASFFDRMGGHAQAAGFTLKKEDLSPKEQCQKLSDALNQRCTLAESDLMPALYIDSPLDASKVTIPFIQSFDLLRPYGTENPRPVFAQKDLSLHRVFLMGQRKNAARLVLKTSEGHLVEAITFRVDALRSFLEGKGAAYAADMEEGRYFLEPISLDIAFEIEINRYHDEERPQILLRSFRESL